jgi:hypothetical protein
MFGLPQTDNPVHWAPEARPVSRFNERFSAAAEAARIQSDDWARRERRAFEIRQQIAEALGPDPTPADIPTFGPMAGRMAMAEARLWERVQSVEPDPMSPLGNLPRSALELEDWLDREAQRQMEELNEVRTLGPVDGVGSAELLGSLYAGVTSDVNVAMMPLGFGAGGVARIAIAEGALAGAGEALSLPRQYTMAEALDLDDPVAWEQIAMAVGVGAATGGALAGGARALRFAHDRYVAVRGEREAGEAEAIPESIGLADGFNQIERARAEMEAGRPITVQGTAETIAPPDTIPEGAPVDWFQIRNGIFAGESGGDYNALFGFSNRPGGQWSNVRLTEMTVDEAIAFSDPSGPYARWVNGQIGRVATPMGAYQIVGTTLRDAKAGLRLRGDELMTPELQDRLGVYILNTQGTGAWVGYRGPRETFTPAPSSARATATEQRPGGWTSRGYTSDGQIRYGDDRRIDVEYEVVDARLLLPAPPELQPRDRSQARSDDWVAATAAGLDPALLMPGPTADRGPPVVGPDDIIESGNGRVLAIRRSYELFPDRGDAYRAQIERAGFAIPPDVSEPVLVARRKTPLEPDQRVEFTTLAQDGGTANMTAPERARVGRSALTLQALDRFDPAQSFRAAGNADFARRWIAAYPKSQQGALIANDGTLAAEGARSMRDAFFARAWDEAGLLERFIEGQPGEFRSLLDALADAAPYWAKFRAGIDAGQILPEMDITDFVTDAAYLIARARDMAAKEGSTVKQVLEDLITDPDLFGRAFAPLTKALVRFMAPAGKQASADTISRFLIRYADEASVSGRVGDPFASGPLDVLQSIDRATFGSLTEIGTPVRPPPAPPSIVINREALERWADGTDNPDVVALDRARIAELANPAPAKSPPTSDETGVVPDDRPRILADDYADMLDDALDGKSGATIRDLIADINDDEMLIQAVTSCLIKGVV